MVISLTYVLRKKESHGVVTCPKGYFVVPSFEIFNQRRVLQNTNYTRAVGLFNARLATFDSDWRNTSILLQYNTSSKNVSPFTGIH